MKPRALAFWQEPWRRSAIAIGVFVFSAFLGLWAASRMGITWDEPAGHFIGVAPAMEWWADFGSAALNGKSGELLIRKNLEAAWPTPGAQELTRTTPYGHPPMRFYAAGLCNMLFGRWLGEARSFRMSSALCYAGTAVLLFLMLDRRGRRAAGIGAAAAWALHPHVVGQAGVMGEDMILAFSWMLTLFVLEADLPWPKAVPAIAVAWAIGLADKFPAFLLPIPFLVYALWDRKLDRVAKLAAAFPAALFLAWLVNPAWWYDPFDKIWTHHILLSISRRDYMRVPTFFLGKVYTPWAPPVYAPIIFLVSTPLTILALAVVGAVKQSHRWSSVGKLAATHVAFFLAVAMAPGAPRNDGPRYLLFVFPFLALLAGLGVHALWERPPRRRLQSLLLALLAYQTLVLALVCPYFLSYFGELAGGPWGARRMGFESTYWFEALSPEVCRWVNENLPPSANLATWPPHPKLLEYLQGSGALRRDFSLGFKDNGYMLLLWRQGFFSPDIWKITQTGVPIREFGFPGVPLIGIYQYGYTRKI